MQLRRVLLLFALVLGLSAIVASIAPPPEPRDEGRRTTAPGSPSAAPGRPTLAVRRLTIAVPPAGGTRGEPRTHPVAAGSRLELEVTAPAPGDVEIEALGLRQSADPFDPARFDLLARPPGRYEVSFVPVRGEMRTVAQLEFARPATVTRPRRAR